MPHTAPRPPALPAPPPVPPRTPLPTMLPMTPGTVLRCMRSWAHGLHRRAEAAAAIGGMMAGLGADQACDYLDAFMMALGDGATRRIVIGRPDQGWIGTDERVLLAILTFAGESRPAEAMLLLRGLVTAAAARPVLRAAQGLATELALAGRFLVSTDLAMPAPTRQPDARVA